MSTLKEQIESASDKIATLSDNRQIHSIVGELLTSVTGAEFASVWVYDGEYLVREREEGVTSISMKEKEGLLYYCFATQEPIVNNHLSSSKGYIPTIDNPDNIKIKSKIMIPINVRDTFIGIVTVYSTIATKKSFTKKDLKSLQALLPLAIDALFKMNFNNSKGLLIDRRQGESASSSFKRRKDDIYEKLESIENKEYVDVQKILEKTSTIVHDIRTPANGLLGFLEILGEKIEDKRLKEYVDNARKSASLIESLTTSILDGISDKSEPVTSAALEIMGSKRYFADIVEVFSANMYKKHISYTIFIDPALPNILSVDGMQLKRVILNLIGNASKFTPEYGSIDFLVRYMKKEKRLYIHVKDTGIGIAKEMQEEIFVAFKQAETDTKEKFGGTGLGLSICASYVKEMGGTLQLESQLDKGSKFYFDIPIEEANTFEHPMLAKGIDDTFISILCDKKNMHVVNTIFRYLTHFGLAKEQVKAVATLSSVPKQTSHIVVFEHKIDNDVVAYMKNTKVKQLIVEENFLALNAQHFPHAMLISQYSYYCDILYTFVNKEHIPKVLIVEDDKISSMLLSSMLQDEYCELDIACDGEDGVKMLLKSLEADIPYDIVYTDINMPKLSGIEMINKYREKEKKKNLKKGLVTVSVSGGVNESIDAGGFDFLATKPYNKQEIVSIFHESIMHRR